MRPRNRFTIFKKELLRNEAKNNKLYIYSVSLLLSNNSILSFFFDIGLKKRHLSVILIFFLLLEFDKNPFIKEKLDLISSAYLLVFLLELQILCISLLILSNFFE